MTINISLQLFTDDEIQVTADHLVRPIMVPRDVQILPWFAGYAEAINAGKSLRNEDQVRTRSMRCPFVVLAVKKLQSNFGCARERCSKLIGRTASTVKGTGKG